jgi:hypothetical protein
MARLNAPDPRFRLRFVAAARPKIPDAESIRKKLRLAGELFRFAIEIKKTALRQKHPDWDERQLALEAYRLVEKGNPA